MKTIRTLKQRSPQLLRALSVLFITAGILLRLIAWWQQRNLVIDEANVARNVFERGFGQLSQPLSYEQYAPPVFLWLVKISTLLFGFGERALWLYPLICGIGAVLLMYRVALRLMPRGGVWLAVGLFAMGGFYVTYSTTLKQYMPDAFIALLLVDVALRHAYPDKQRGWFMLKWILFGSLAIWSSMPSVFVLAGIGLYYTLPLLRVQAWKALIPLLIVFAVWLGQFLFYYETVLKAQADSDYLQNYHRDFFLYAWPSNGAEWSHNFNRLYEIAGYMGGWTVVAMASNLLFLTVGIFAMVRKDTRRLLLLTVPFVAVLVAAAFHKFSLIERVIMFLYPLLLLVVGYGFGILWQGRVAVIKPFILLAGIITIVGYAHLQSYVHPEEETFQITEGLSYLAAKKVRGSQLYVPSAGHATYIFYTTIHPMHPRLSGLQGAHLLRWDDDFSKEVQPAKDTAWVIFSEDFKEDQRNRRLGELNAHMRQVAAFEGHNVWVFGYTAP